MSNLGGHLQKVVAYKSLDHIGLKHRELRALLFTISVWVL